MIMDYRVLAWYCYICYVVLNFAFCYSSGQEGFQFDYQNLKDLFKDSGKATRTTVCLVLALNIFGKLIRCLYPANTYPLNCRKWCEICLEL